MSTSGRLAAALLAAVVVAACGGEQGGGGDGGGGRLSIATGNTTGVYYVMGGGYAQLISDHVEGYQATAEATGASVENIQRVARGESDIAFTLADTAADAANGTGSFDGKQPIRALARIYDNYTQVVVRSDSGITSVAQMKGRRVSTGSPNSGTEVIAERLLTAAGLDPDSDIERQRLSLPETTSAMKDGAVDAMFWSGGLPTAGVTDLTSSMGGGVRFLDLSGQLASLQDEFGDVYQQASIPADAYGLDADVPTISVPNMLVVNESMDDDLAFDLVRVLFEFQGDLAEVHAEAKNIKVDAAPDTDPVELHPGASRYYGDR